VTLCGAWSLVQDLTGITTVIPLRCRSWTCPTCAPRLRRRLLKRLADVHVDALLTLTCNPRIWATPGLAFQRMTLAIPLLVKRIRRRYPNARVQYFLVWERTAAGWPHAHLLLQAPYLPQEWLSAQWNQLTGAYVIDIRQVTSRSQARGYVSKYLAKDPAVPTGYRRFRSSLLFFPIQPPRNRLELPEEERWHLARYETWSLAKLYAGLGWKVYWAQNGSFTALSPPKERPLELQQQSPAGQARFNLEPHA